MRATTRSVIVVAVLLASTSACYSQSDRYLLMEGDGEFGWSINRPGKIDGEAEGRSLALAALNGKIEKMANIEAFEQFSSTEVRNTLSNKYEEIGPAIRNTITFAKEDRKSDAFRGNRRGLVVTVEERGFKAGTFSNSSDYNKLTGVRKSKASGILLYNFRIYAPEGYNPAGGIGNSNRREVWQYDGGSVRRVGQGRWEDRNSTGHYTFRELSSTKSYIELYDDSRDYTVRLDENALYIRGGNDSVRTRFSRFTKLHDGGWAK